ncbi:UDP-4-amino-4-deoxy-L-arabinose--oxoglutarate aminotransferase [compost metagenome]
MHHVAPEQRQALFQQLRAQGIGANVHYMPIYQQPWYQREQQTSLPQAEQFYAGAITLPLFPGLSSAQQDLIHTHLLSTI